MIAMPMRRDQVINPLDSSGLHRIDEPSCISGGGHGAGIPGIDQQRLMRMAIPTTPELPPSTTMT